MKQNDAQKRRRIFCMVFSALLCLSLCFPAFADDAGGAISSEEFLANILKTYQQRRPEKTSECFKQPFLYEEEESEPAAQSSGFSYVHDPRVNPEAMKDIIENPKAVYGFSPDPESTRLGAYAQYDWTDPDLVAKAKEDRIAYHESLDSMTDILQRMRDEGATIEEIARAVSTERNRLRLAAYENDPDGLAEVKKSNLETYGHEDGPTPDEMYEKYGSWEKVLQKAFSANLGMDVCCGLYDEYYPLYIELGYAEP